MTLSIDLFWSFRSPYSYLATPRLVEMQRDYDLNINVRPVYPLAVRSGEFFGQVNPMWIPYLMRDTYRLSQMLGLPYRWPRPDPVVVDPTTRAAIPNQRPRAGEQICDQRYGPCHIEPPRCRPRPAEPNDHTNG